LRSVEEQQARVAAAAVAPRPVKVAIAEAQGLMCAEEVVTERPLPGFDQAAIDGYAVRSVDVLGAEPIGYVDEDATSGDVREISLPVMATIQAGEKTPSRLQPRQAARVQTGAPMPTLADAVLPLRWTDGGESRVRVLRSVRSGAYVRRTGDDVQPGDVAVRAGTIIGAAQVGLLAAVGRERVLVHPRPRLSVMCVGGELVDISRSSVSWRRVSRPSTIASSWAGATGRFSQAFTSPARSFFRSKLSRRPSFLTTMYGISSIVS